MLPCSAVPCCTLLISPELNNQLHPLCGNQFFHYNWRPWVDRVIACLSRRTRWAGARPTTKGWSDMREMIFQKQSRKREPKEKQAKEDHAEASCKTNMNFQQICWLPEDLKEWSLTDQSILWRPGPTSLNCLQRREAEPINKGSGLPPESTQQTHSGGDDTMQTPRDICHWQEESKPQRDTCVWRSHWTLEPLAKLRDFCHWRTCCHERDISRTWRQRVTNKPVWYLAEYIYIGILIRTKAFAIIVNIFVYYGLNSGLSTLYSLSGRQQ